LNSLHSVIVPASVLLLIMHGVRAGCTGTGCDNLKCCLVRFEVADTGVGMSAQDLKHIFEVSERYWFAASAVVVSTHINRFSTVLTTRLTRPPRSPLPNAVTLLG